MPAKIPIDRAESREPVPAGVRPSAAGAEDAPLAATSPVWQQETDEFMVGLPGDPTGVVGGDDDLAPLWSVPWSDLMMVMFVLFAVLLTVQQRIDRRPQVQPVERPAPVPEPQVETRIELEDNIVERAVEVPRQAPSFEPLIRLDVLSQSEQAVREAGIDNVEVLLTDDQSVKVSVRGPMFFEQGKADLRIEVQDFLDRLAAVIARTPYDIEVVGHTDDQPVATTEFPSNWELSLVRAARVARYLLDESAIDPERFTVMGRSQYAPSVANVDAASRALNRRVEIIITRRRAGRVE